jgi:cysteine synthase A
MQAPHLHTATGAPVMLVSGRPSPAPSPLADGVGQTPLLELRKLTHGLPGRVAVKLESRNPTGSVKDRVATALVDEAERQGRLLPGGSLVAATSGNMGLALARIAAARGYRARFAIPEDWCHERLALLLYLGADVALTAGGHMGAAAARARALAAADRSHSTVLLDQFSSEANFEVHRSTTAEEIWSATAGEVAGFVAGVGTGGTIRGVAEGLRARRADVYVRAVEPATSPVLSGGPAGRHRIQGIGAGFVPPLFRYDLVDDIVTVRDDEAFDSTRRLACEEGILAGVSSGAAVAAATALAARPQMRGKLIVTIVADSAERYVIVPRLEGPGGRRGRR